MYIGLKCYVVLTNTEVLLSTLGDQLFYRQAKSSRVQARGGYNIFTYIICITELSLHAEFQILIKFCGGWSTASEEAQEFLNTIAYRLVGPKMF